MSETIVRPREQRSTGMSWAIIINLAMGFWWLSQSIVQNKPSLFWMVALTWLVAVYIRWADLRGRQARDRMWAEHDALIAYLDRGER